MVKIFKILFMLFLFPLSVWAQETEVVLFIFIYKWQSVGGYGIPAIPTLP